MNNGENQMDEKLARKINRNLRGIKVMLGFLMFTIFGMLAILGFLAWTVLTFTQKIESKVTDIQNTTQQKLDIKSQLCTDANKNALTSQFCN